MLRTMAAKSSDVLKRKMSDSGSSGATAAKKPFGHWSQGLKASMEDPSMRVEADDKIVIIKDKYPKASFHFLVMPRESIANLKQLKKDHLPLLRHMQEKGQALAKKSSEHLKFRCGYHAIPSMSHVHMHVISQDFDSPCLKTKKHWNSFTTEYFMDSTDVIEQLEEEGKIAVDTSKFTEILKRPLKCHVCSKSFSTMPALKSHLLSHIPAKAKS